MNDLPYDLSSPKYDLEISPPLMNAAGTLGFAPEPKGAVNLELLGAFITNPISLQARTSATTRTSLPYPGAFLLPSGYPNPGLRTAMRRYAARWARSSMRCSPANCRSADSSRRRRRCRWTSGWTPVGLCTRAHSIVSSDGS